MTVTAQQRFTRVHPCPVCGGDDDDARGHGARCFGFLSDDGEWAHCTRLEKGGGVRYFDDSQTYAHRLVGDCRCGVRHDPQPSSNGRAHLNGSAGLNGVKSRIDTTYDYHDEQGGVLFQVVKYYPKAFKQRRPDGHGDWIWNLQGVRLAPYRLPELIAADPSATVYVVEGEKDVDRLRELGLVATTNAMGAGKWQGEYSDWLRDRHVVILPDNDDAGRHHALTIATFLDGIAATVKIVELPDLPGKGDASDWIDAGGTVLDLQQHAARAPLWEPERPDREKDFPVDESGIPTSSATPENERPWPEPPGNAAFAGLAGQFVESLLPHTEADPVALLLSFLCAFPIAVGSGPHCIVGATRHALRLFVVLVGRSAKARKGDSAQATLRVFSGADPDWTDHRVVSGLSSGEGFIWAVRDAITRLEPVREKGRVKAFEMVMADPGESDKRLLVLESEFARVLAVMSRQGNTLSPVIRQAWDSGDLRVLTKTNAAKATGAHIGILAHVTEEELRRELSDTETVNGFANRLLFAMVRRSKLLPEPEPFAGEKAASLARDVSETLIWSRTVGQIDRSPSAKEFWADIYADLSEERPGLFGALTARAEAQCLRLSAIYALLDRSMVVQPEHIVSALELWGYVERSTSYLFGNATGDPIADTIRAALRMNGEMTRNQICDFFGRHETSARIAHALRSLSLAGLAVSESREGKGRPAEVWRAT